MIVLFDDFGIEGPYVGQVKAVIERERPGTPVIDLQHDAPRFDPKAAAHLLAALVSGLPPGTVFLAVVDPGVGTDRKAAIVHADHRWYVGPDNGLFDVITARAGQARWWDMTWRPRHLTATFHGRDLFAPVAARLAGGARPPGDEVAFAQRIGPGAGDDLGQVVYIDGYGNAMTGLRGATVPQTASLEVAGRRLMHAETFGAVAAGEAFWYVNSIGLVEVAVAQGSATGSLGLRIGEPVAVA